jgi:hypothetical protein
MVMTMMLVEEMVKMVSKRKWSWNFLSETEERKWCLLTNGN